MTLVRVLIVILTVSIVFYSCKSGIAGKETGNDSAAKTSDAEDRSKWTAGDEEKFMNDCNREFSETTGTDKLNAFCSCILTEAKKYYDSYEEMNRDNSKKLDAKLYSDCLKRYPVPSIGGKDSAP